MIIQRGETIELSKKNLKIKWKKEPILVLSTEKLETLSDLHKNLSNFCFRITVIHPVRSIACPSLTISSKATIVIIIIVLCCVLSFRFVSHLSQNVYICSSKLLFLSFACSLSIIYLLIAFWLCNVAILLLSHHITSHPINPNT